MKKMTVVVLAVLVVVGVTACSPNDPVLPVPATSVEQATEDASTSMSMSFTRTRIYESLHEVAEDCTIVIVGTAAGKQRLQEDYPGPLTLTEITVTEVLKGSAEVGSTITLGASVHRPTRRTRSGSRAVRVPWPQAERTCFISDRWASTADQTAN